MSSSTPPPTPASIPGPDPVEAPEVEEPSKKPPFSQSWVGRTWPHFIKSGVGQYQTAFLILILIALALRLWELGGRTMHYDEAIHLYSSWRLANFDGFHHSPWMHGPFQIELVALLFKLFGDSDFTARLAYALFGSALVALPYFLRQQLGRTGALLTGTILAISPVLLYFSRFGRNDIIMAFLATTLFVLMWRYSQESKNRYLYGSAALLALIFATKETSYIIALTFGALALLMALIGHRLDPKEKKSPPGDPTDSPPTDSATRLVGTKRFITNLTRRALAFRLSALNRWGGFLVLLITLTLPQWSAGVELARSGFISFSEALLSEAVAGKVDSFLELNLVNRDGVVSGLVGAPHWEAPFVLLPLVSVPTWVHWVALTLFIGAGYFLARRRFAGLRRQLIATAIATAMVAGIALALLRPFSNGWELFIAGISPVSGLVALFYWRFSWNQSLFLTLVPLGLTIAYTVIFTPLVMVDDLLRLILPSGVHVDSDGNSLPLNIVAAGGVVALAGLISLLAGLLWRGRRWLICAVIFYAIWLTLYTTFYTNLAGIFSGVWQGMGYWIAQQEVARGNQPWYYYFVGLSVYEFVAVIFGLLGAYVCVKRRDPLGIALTFWGGVNLLAYTIASEKMPWLLVNIVVPFAFLAGKLLGELAERVVWRQVTELRRSWKFAGLLAIPPLILIGSLYAVLYYTGAEAPFSLNFGGVGILAGLVLLASATAWLVRSVGAESGAALVGLSVAALLLGFTVWTAFRATYTYDDSVKEILVYAQGSADLRKTVHKLEQDIAAVEGSVGGFSPIMVDYDIWYPLQWYVRRLQGDDLIRFSSFKDQDRAVSCQADNLKGAGGGFLVAAHHHVTDSSGLINHRQTGPQRNLLWFPETYRRNDENRQSEELMEELSKDLRFFGEVARERRYWNQMLNYLIYRKLASDWFFSEYYTCSPE